MVFVKEYIPQYNEYIDQIVIQWSLIVIEILPAVEREIMKYVRVIKFHGKTEYHTTEALNKLRFVIVKQFQALVSEYRAFATLIYGPLFKFGCGIKDKEQKELFMQDLERYFCGNEKEPPLYDKLLEEVQNAKDINTIIKCFREFYKMLMDVGVMLATAGLLDISRRKIDTI